MNECDPRYRDMAATILDEFAWPDLDVRRARERSLARSLEITADAEIADLRAAEARRIIGIDGGDAMARNL